MIISILRFIMIFLYIYVVDTIGNIFMSRQAYKDCKGNCKDCKMWSCTNQTDYDGKARLFPYDNFKNVCGKEKFTFN